MLKRIWTAADPAAKVTGGEDLIEKTDHTNEICLHTNDSLYNAGLLGLKRVLNRMGELYNPDIPYCDVQDSSICVQKGAFSEKFTTAYFDVLIEHYGNDTVYSRLIRNLETILSPALTADMFIEKSNELLQKKNKTTGKENKANANLEKFIKAKGSYISGFDILRNYYDIDYDFIEKIELAKKEKSPVILKKILKEIYEHLNNKDVKHILILKGIAHTRVNQYWDGVSFLSSQKNKKQDKPWTRIPFEQAFYDYFITPITEYTPKKGKKVMGCFQCGRTLQAGASSTAWVNKTMPDVKRKTDSFWNYIPDIMMCPFCMLVYACVPLGFTTFANEGVFVNDCRSMKALDSANCFTDVSDELKDDTFAAVINRFTLTADEKQAKGDLQNVQVVRCSGGNYKVNTLTADMLEAFIHLKPTFEKLLKANPRLFHQTMAHVLNGQELYGMMLKGYRDTLEKGYSLNVYSLVLNIQIEMFGRKKEKTALETDKSTKWAAYKSGQALRSKIKSVSKESGKAKANEKRLVGVTYRLLNALQSSDYRLFMDTIERQYISLSSDIPHVFLSAVNNDEMLQMVGHAFVQGLNSNVENNDKEAGNKENASTESEG